MQSAGRSMPGKRRQQEVTEQAQSCGARVVDMCQRQEIGLRPGPQG